MRRTRARNAINGERLPTWRRRREWGIKHLACCEQFFFFVFRVYSFLLRVLLTTNPSQMHTHFSPLTYHPGPQPTVTRLTTHLREHSCFSEETEARIWYLPGTHDGGAKTGREVIRIHRGELGPCVWNRSLYRFPPLLIYGSYAVLTHVPLSLSSYSNRHRADIISVHALPLLGRFFINTFIKLLETLIHTNGLRRLANQRNFVSYSLACNFVSETTCK